MLLNWLARPRGVLVWIAALCVGFLAFGMYLQHVVGLEPCPMCIVQRYALVLIAFFSVLASVFGRKSFHQVGAGSVALLSVGGAFVAARQSWLQWYPPENASCGRDLYGMIETFPLREVIPMVFRGSGDCTAIDWTFLGGSIANWSFLNFLFLGGLAAASLIASLKFSARRS